MRVVLASGNAGKVRELRQLLGPLDIEVLPQSDFDVPNVTETGLSFIENAILKARHAAMHTQLPAIADDSGIEVDALHGAPGIYSARYAGEGASDADNLRKLIRELSAVPATNRTARYRCALVFMRSEKDSSPIVCQASWEGRLLDSPRGSGGFGYDPLFVPEGVSETFAELGEETKNRISHRSNALRKLKERLTRVGNK